MPRAAAEHIDRVAWVSGGASGIGSAVVAELTRSGARVGVLDMQDAADVPSVRCDVSSPVSLASAARRLANLVGEPDIVVNSAGVSVIGEIGDLRDEDWDRALGVNVTGAFRLLRLVMPGMCKRRWGRIVSVSSGSAVRVHRGQAAYAASKAALVALTKVAVVEGAPFGVTANVVAPGVTDTPMTRAIYGGEEALEQVATESAIANPMAVLLDPKDHAGAVSDFASQSAAHVTGQVLHVSAGSVMP